MLYYMLRSEKMQYHIHQKFISEQKKQEIGEMHNSQHKRQMFLLHIHALLFPEKLARILLYNGNEMDISPDFFLDFSIKPQNFGKDVRQ